MSTSRRITEKEDAGCSMSADPDKPYNLIQRLYLRMMGTLLARQLI